MSKKLEWYNQRLALVAAEIDFIPVLSSIIGTYVVDPLVSAKDVKHAASCAPRITAEHTSRNNRTWRTRIHQLDQEHICLMMYPINSSIVHVFKMSALLMSSIINGQIEIDQILDQDGITCDNIVEDDQTRTDLCQQLYDRMKERYP